MSEECSGVSDFLVWVDCEMTGLDPATDALIEVAALMAAQGALQLVFHAVSWGAAVALEATGSRRDS